MFIIKCELCGVESKIKSYTGLVGIGDIEIIEIMNHGIRIECSCGNTINEKG